MNQKLFDYVLLFVACIYCFPFGVPIFELNNALTSGRIPETEQMTVINFSFGCRFSGFLRRFVPLLPLR